jgi:hypothetical protein
MSSFPPPAWEVRFLEDLDTFEPTFPASWKLGVAALLVVKPASGTDGAFRLVLGGSQHVDVKVTAEEVFGHPAMAGYELRGRFQPGPTIKMAPNSTTSVWMDVKERVYLAPTSFFPCFFSPFYFSFFFVFLTNIKGTCFLRIENFSFLFIFPSVSPLPRNLGILFFPWKRKFLFFINKSYSTQGIRCRLPVLWIVFFSLPQPPLLFPKYKKILYKKNILKN